MSQIPASRSLTAAPPLAVLRRFDIPTPDYATYPAENRYAEAFGADDCVRALRQRGCGATVGGGTPLSIHLRIPFCESLCNTCSLRQVVTRRHARAGAYVDALAQEVSLLAAALGTRQAVSRLHIGGGTPLFLADAELARIAALLRGPFRFTRDVEMSIEVDSRLATPQRLGHLRALGFNRICVAIQDFDAGVQQAVHRVQPLQGVVDLVQAARQAGFAGIRMEVMYGLPLQTPAKFARTMQHVAALRPDRVCLFRYEHLPSRFKPQRHLRATDLPSSLEWVTMRAGGIDSLRRAGYSHLGMDDYALDGDPLAVARRQGRLHLDALGFGTRPEGDTLALGMAAVGRVGASHYQNAVNLSDYHDALGQGELPVARGIVLTRDDLARRAVIMALMCQGRVDMEAISLSHLIDMRRYFARELEQLAPLARAGLVRIESDAIELTAAGAYLARVVATVFDRDLQRDERLERFSSVV